MADEQATADYKSVHARLIEDFHCDPNCNSGLAQVFRLPGLMHWKSGTPYLVHTVNAPGFRYGREELIKAFPPVGKRSAEIMTFSPPLVPDDNENQRIRDALFSVSADCGRDVWVKIGMSLEGHYGQAGEALFDEWSRTAKIAGKYNERDLKTTWRSFRGSGITIGTLFCFARDGGWEGETNRLYEEWCRKHAAQKSNGDNKPTPGWSYYDGSAERKPMRWAIKNIIPEVGFGILSGQWGMFKTTAALELSLSVMTGGMFAGQYRVKRVGPVAYIALEGARMIAARLAAIAQERGVTGRLPFAWRDNCPALTDKNAAEVICGYLKEIEAQYDGQPPALVWIDTVITAAGYQSEGADNDTSATQMVMNCLSAVAKEAVGFVFGIDHFGKVIETGTRGSSAKEGAVDTIIAALGDRAVSGEVKNTRLAMRKQRDGLSGFEIPYTPRTIVTGEDEDGDVETAVIFDWGKAQQPKDTKAGWTGSLRLFWRVLTTALVDGQDYRPFSDGPLVRAVDIEAVRAEFYRQYAADGPDGQKRVAKRQAFNKALNGAQAKNLVACRESGGVQWVWVVTPEES